MAGSGGFVLRGLQMVKNDGQRRSLSGSLFKLPLARIVMSETTRISSVLQ
jgi:hypothetical protein